VSCVYWNATSSTIAHAAPLIHICKAHATAQSKRISLAMMNSWIMKEWKNDDILNLKHTRKTPSNNPKKNPPVSKPYILLRFEPAELLENHTTRAIRNSVESVLFDLRGSANRLHRNREEPPVVSGFYRLQTSRLRRTRTDMRPPRSRRCRRRRRTEARQRREEPTGTASAFRHFVSSGPLPSLRPISIGPIRFRPTNGEKALLRRTTPWSPS
jgi:hypothetical protein